MALKKGKSRKVKAANFRKLQAEGVPRKEQIARVLDATRTGLSKKKGGSRHGSAKVAKKKGSKHGSAHGTKRKKKKR